MGEPRSFINVYVSVKNLIAFPCLIFFQDDAGPTSAVKVCAKYGGRGGCGGFTDSLQVGS